jgi:hypothetical protein
MAVCVCSNQPVIKSLALYKKVTVSLQKAYFSADFMFISIRCLWC